jgi:urease subunit alpha
MFGAFGAARSATSVHFVSRAALDRGLGQELGLTRRLVAVRQTRGVRKRDLIHNDYMPHMEVDAQTYEVRADGELLVCEPARELPLAQRYFLF